jgi:hypothetical protein
MELAGKYLSEQTGYTPDVFPDQRLMQAYANQATNPQLRAAALEFQYPFKMSDLKNSNYTDEIKYIIMQATMGTMG